MSLPTKQKEKIKKLAKQLAWFVGLYLAALVVIGGFIYFMRFILGMG